MSDGEMQRDIGSMEAHLQVLQREMKELKDDVRQIRDDFAAVRGGGRVFMGIAALAGGAVTWAIGKFLGSH